MYTTILLGYKPARNDPFTIAFVYPKNGQPLVVKGSASAVNGYLKRFPMALVNITYWKNKQSRNFWRFTCQNVYLRRVSDTQSGFQLRVYDTKSRQLVRTKRFKRVPHKWVPEFDVP